ncbi:MAG: NAD(P)/FAD-dependent oxidoreductase [Deltaproteobacteria bacterium]|nr:NAD(P)/FAD-dependent oxidoreductase [Deltaproteobacteria bacterium]
MKHDGKRPRIGVLGGGLAGLTAAYRLSESGFDVTVLERDGELGGLAKAITIDGFPIDVYYHHAFSSDAALWGLCAELGLSGSVRWLKSPMGYLTDGKVYQFGTIASLLKFKPLGIADKIRFITSTLKLKSERDLGKLEGFTADEWLRRHAGERVYEVIWKPLLVQKFGPRYDKIGITFIARKVQQRSETRKLGQESLAYMEGSFGRITDALAGRIRSNGGEIRTGANVTRISRDGDALVVEDNKTKTRFDKVVATFAPGVLKGLCDFPAEYRAVLDKLEHMAVICAMLITKKPLSGIYWLNVGDNSFPFGAVVEHTNLWGTEHYGGRHIIYISKYLSPDDPVYKSKDKDILGLFYKHIKRVNPLFDAEKDVTKALVFRSVYAQPFITAGYGSIKPGIKTPVEGLYWVSTSHIYPEDRGVNYSIKLGMEVSELVKRES